MLGEARQPRSRRPGPSEGVTEPREHVAEPGQARHHRGSREVAPASDRVRGDKRSGVLGRLGPWPRSPRPGGRGRSRRRHHCCSPYRRLSRRRSPERRSRSRCGRGASRWSSRCCSRSGARPRWPPRRSRRSRPIVEASSDLLHDALGRDQATFAGAHRPDSARVFSTLMPRNSADGQPWLTGATWPGWPLPQLNAPPRR